MADAQASGACVGNNVWVQVPSPAFYELTQNAKIVAVWVFFIYFFT